ncbi:MAG: 5'-3' exonuclease, partial [Holosporales bacterium]
MISCFDSQHRFYLVDASGFIFRAFHALPPLENRQGTPVGAVYGFLSMLIRLLSDHHPEKLGVIFDVSRKTFRQDLYPLYKANRPPPPPELIGQFSLVRQACKAFGLPVLESEGFEADDLLASYAVAAAHKGEKVTLVSSDKDLMQLVSPEIRLWDPMKNKPLNEPEVLEKFGVPPSQVVEVQALLG